MKIALDTVPLKSGHKIRGIGFYTDNLIKSLKQYDKQNSYTFFTRGEKLPKDIDLVHYPYFEPFFLSLPLMKPAKTVVTIHDLIPLVFPNYFPMGIKGRLKWEIQKLSLKSVSAIITDSQSSKGDIIKYTSVPDSKIHVVYLAPNEEFKVIKETLFPKEKTNKASLLLQSIKEKYKLPEKFILYVGDATWNKNLPRLIEASKTIKIPLVMIGQALIDQSFDRTNPWNKDLVKVHQLIDGAKNIIRPGFITVEELATFYNLATVFIMPSLYEGFGLPILEAMSCGCPVITTREGSLSEVAGEAAFYVNASDTDSIAGGMKKLLFNDELRQELSRKGLRQAKKFSWRKTAEETIKVYESV